MLPGVGYTELLFIIVIAILLFGKNLPGVAKTIGKQYGKLRRSITDVQKSLDVSENETEDYSANTNSGTYDYEEYDEPTAPKFDPPPSD